MTTIITAPTEYQIPVGLLPPDSWGIVAEYMEGGDLCGSLSPVLNEKEKRDKFREQVQKEYDRNLVIFWEAICHSEIWFFLGIELMAHQLRWEIAHHPNWFNEDERKFINQYSGVSEAVRHHDIIAPFHAICPYTRESAQTIRSLLANPNLKPYFEDLIFSLDYRVYRPGVHQPITLVVPEISVFEKITQLNFGNTDRLINQPVNLRALTNLSRIDMRGCSLRPEDLIVNHRVRAKTDNNDYLQLVPDRLPLSISISTYATHTLTESRGENRSLKSRVSYTLGYLGLMLASLIETIVRAVFSILFVPIGLLVNHIKGHDAGYGLLDFSLRGTLCSAINILACAHAIFANLATKKELKYSDLASGLSHKQILKF